MKRFLIHTAFFSLPVIALFLLEGLISPSVFTYRPWEALAFQTEFAYGKPFHPNAQINMTSVGDLAHHTPYEVNKEESWKTDKLGYRNEAFLKRPDILLIGDSFIAGSGLSQKDMLSEQLYAQMETKLSVYNMAPASFYDFDYLLREHEIEKPQILIYSLVERSAKANIPQYRNYEKAPQGLLKNSPRLATLLDRCFRLYSFEWVKARINKTQGYGKKGEGDTRMFFLDGENHTYSSEDISRTLGTLQAYQSYCDSAGIEFVFLPLPNKETVYHDLVPLASQPEFLHVLCREATLAGIKTVNSLKVYNDYRHAHAGRLYHDDDTHWNRLGVQLLAQELMSTLNQSPYLAERVSRP